MGSGQEWYEDGPLVRPYAVTRGRTRAQRPDLQVITLVAARYPRGRAALNDLEDEHLVILELSQKPVSIAELAAQLRLPLSVVKILVADLVERGLMGFREAVTPDVAVLQAVLNGIRRL